MERLNQLSELKKITRFLTGQKGSILLIFVSTKNEFNEQLATVHVKNCPAWIMIYINVLPQEFRLSIKSPSGLKVKKYRIPMLHWFIFPEKLETQISLTEIWPEIKKLLTPEKKKRGDSAKIIPLFRSRK